MEAGLIGGIVGGAFGLTGGAVGTYFSIKNTLGPRERSFMTKASVFAWAAITAFVVGLLMLPRPYSLLLWVPYGVALPLGIRWCNRRQMTIREQEAASRASESVRASR